MRGNDSISQEGTGRTAHIDTVVTESEPALVPPDSFGYAAKKSLEAMLARVYTDSITDWRLFWPKLKKAIIKRDTFTVLGLTRFPFSYEYSELDARSFVDVPLNLLFDNPLKQQGKPRRQAYDEDSAFSIDIPPQELIFGKVKGCYKLLTLLTPG